MKILQKDLQPAEFSRIVWAVRPEHGVTLEDLLKPEAWAHVAKSLKPGARIEVFPPDGSFYAELLVRSADANSADVFPLFRVDFSEAAEDAPASQEYELKFAGAAKWRVLRKIDGAVMVEGLTKPEAEAWLTKRVEALA